MTRHLPFVFVFAAALAAQADGAVAARDATVGRLAATASEELARGIAALNRVRGDVDAEKLPLAEELTRLEAQLSQLRREQDQQGRAADEARLALAGIKARLKARQDEFAYDANLLDEYARTLETRLDVSELQVSGKAIEVARLAVENATLGLDEKFDRQLAVVDASLQRATDAVGGMRFPGTAVAGDGTVAQGQFALFGPVALFASPGGAAGVVVAQSGSTRPVVRPLDDDLQAGVRALVQQGEGKLPLDASLGGALKALVQKTNILHIFQKGGPIMWPLLVASVLALGTVLERLLFLANERRKRDRRTRDALFTEIEHGDVARAITVGQRSKDFVVRALRYALEHREQSLASALLYAQGRELKRFKRGIPILDTVITLAPLLGLLGTVTGMMGSFSLIGGELSAPGAITGGIAEALIATAFGLGIAITSLLPFNFLNARLEEASHELESAAAQLELLLQAQGRGRRDRDLHDAPAAAAAAGA